MVQVRVEGQWRARPWLAALLRLLMVGVPVLAGTVAARLVGPHLGAGASRWLHVAIVLAVAVAVSVAVSRLTNRLMPLAMLLRMTMIFPDQAPSRLKVARRTTSMGDINARLTSPRLEEQDAATTMLALVTALGRHDRHTRGHSERVRLFCDLLARELKLSAADTGRLRWAALVHDIGKLHIPVAVLNKPGKLNEREWELIRQHPGAGAALAAPLQEWLGPWFAGIAEHHERYDGTGYPKGLAAGAISPAGRAVAVVDAFETMTASRSYKSARSTLSARAELTRCAGSHFDPVMVRAFLGIALPRLLWSVGPLAFIVNVPFLQWLGEGGVRVAAGATTGAVNAAGVTAVVMAVGAAPTASASPIPQPHHRAATSTVSHRTTARPAPEPEAHGAAKAPTHPPAGQKATHHPAAPGPHAPKPVKAKPHPKKAHGTKAPPKSQPKPKPKPAAKPEPPAKPQPHKASPPPAEKGKAAKGHKRHHGKHWVKPPKPPKHGGPFG